MCFFATRLLIVSNKQRMMIRTCSLHNQFPLPLPAEVLILKSVIKIGCVYKRTRSPVEWLCRPEEKRGKSFRNLRIFCLQLAMGPQNVGFWLGCSGTEFVGFSQNSLNPHPGSPTTAHWAKTLKMQTLPRSSSLVLRPRRTQYMSLQSSYCLPIPR